MITKKNATIGILIIPWLVISLTQGEAQTTDEQKQALMGEWSGVWPGIHRDTSRLIIHEIDTEKAKARCTYISPRGTYPVMADFIPGANPKLEFKLDYGELDFVLKESVLKANFKGMVRGMNISNTTDMVKKPKK